MQFRIQAILASSVLLVGTFAALLQTGEAATAPRRPVVSVRPRPSATTTVRRSTLGSRRAATPVRRTTTRVARNPYANQPAMGRRGAFSPAMINSKPQLMQYLRNNPRFRKTLAKHFRVTEDEVLNYAQDNLQLITLKNNMRVKTYGVSKTGKIFPANQTLPKGSKVFALSDGTVVMKQICGNPVLVQFPPVPGRKKVFGQAIPPGPQMAANPLVPSGTVGEMPVEDVVLPPIPTVVGALAPNMAPALPGAAGVGGAGGLAGGAGGVVGAAGGGGFPLAALAGAAGAAGLIGGASGGSDSAGTVPFGWFPEDTPEIPEPSAYLLFLSGAAPVFFMAFRRRRREDEVSND